MIGIPWGLQHFKMIRLAIAPFGKEIVAPGRTSEMRGPMSGRKGKWSKMSHKGKHKMKGKMKEMMEGGREMVERV